MESNRTTIVFGGGCFWCTEAVFKMLKGVISIMPGYAGGSKENPTYEEVSGQGTGHAETVRIEYDPDVIAVDDLLTVFFATHDPTQKNRQGNDVGEQYRSIILCTNEDQMAKAREFIQKLNQTSEKGGAILTEVKHLAAFYPAEDYHKDYYECHPDEPYCQVIINPKLKKVQEDFENLIKDEHRLKTQE